MILNKDNSIKSILVVTLLITLAAGNSNLYGLDLALLHCYILTFLFFHQTPTINIKTAIWCIFVFLLFVWLVILGFNLKINYYNIEIYELWPLKVLLSIGPVLWISNFGFNKVNINLFYLFNIFLIIIGDVEDGRLYSLFGPNMLYRLFCFQALFVFYEVLSNRQSLITRMLIFCIALYGIMLTGSVGGLVVFVFGFAFISYTVLSINKLVWLSGVLTVLSVSIYSIVPLEDIGSVARLLYKVENLSNASRYYMWSDLIGIKLKFFGYAHENLSNYWEYGFMYPHNIFLELYIFYGVSGVVLCSLIFLSLLFLKQFLLINPIMGIFVLVWLLSSLLSGDLSDNFAVITLSVVMLSTQRLPVKLRLRL